MKKDDQDYHRSSGRPTPPDSFWKGLDWSQPYEVLVAETGFSDVTIRKHGKRLGLISGRKPSSKASKWLTEEVREKFVGVDWSKVSDLEKLAEDLGLSFQTVRTERLRALVRGDVRNEDLPRRVKASFLEDVKRLKAAVVDWSKTTISEAAEKYGVSPSAAAIVQQVAIERGQNTLTEALEPEVPEEAPPLDLSERRRPELPAPAATLPQAAPTAGELAGALRHVERRAVELALHRLHAEGLITDDSFSARDLMDLVWSE